MKGFVSYLRGLPPSIRYLLITVALSRTGSMVVTFLSLYVARVFHFSPANAGRVMAIFSAGSVIATLVGGVLVDRWGSRRVILLSYFGGCLAIAALITPAPIAVLFVIIFCCGFCLDLLRPAASTLISHTLSGTTMVKTFSLHHMMINLGFMVAPLIGSFLIGYGFRPLFGWNILILVCCFLMIWRCVHDPRRTAHRKATDPMAAGVSGSATIFRLLPFSLAMAQQLISAMLFVQTTAFLALYVENTLHQPTWYYGTTLSWNAIGCVVMGYPVAGYVARWHPFIGSGVGMFIFGLGTALFGAAHDLPGLLFAMTILTLGEVMSVAVTNNLIVQLSPAHMRGKLFGVSHAMMSAGFMLGPLAGSLLIEIVAYRAFWWWIGGLGLLSLAIGCVGYQLTPAMSYRTSGKAVAGEPSTVTLVS